MQATFTGAVIILMVGKDGEVGMIQIDMPMPERCGVCFAMHTDEIGLESWCGIDETARDLYTADINTKRPEWCPLKEQESIIDSLESDLRETLDVVADRGNVVRCKDCKHFLAKGILSFCSLHGIFRVGCDCCYDGLRMES